MKDNAAVVYIESEDLSGIFDDEPGTVKFPEARHLALICGNFSQYPVNLIMVKFAQSG